MATNYIYRNCGPCQGTGKQTQDADNGQPESEIDCPDCNGTGKRFWGEIRDELIGEE